MQDGFVADTLRRFSRIQLGPIWTVLNEPEPPVNRVNKVTRSIKVQQKFMAKHCLVAQTRARTLLLTQLRIM